MRRNRRERPTATAFRSSELRWMALGVMTLVVLFLLISRLREQGATGRNADAAQTAAEPQASATAAPLPKPTGPTGEDPKEADAAKNEFQALTDGTLTLGPEEMTPYNRLVSWVKSQSFARLWARGEKNPAYTFLHDDADRRRGKLVALDVEIRLVRNAGKNDAGVALYEAWAASSESGSHLYDLVIVDFSAKMPVGVAIRERAKFAGYFLKVQGYTPASARPGQPPERAPLLIGRLEWNPIAAAPPTDARQDWVWGAAALAVALLVLAASVMFWRPKRLAAALHPGILPPPSGGVIPVEVWLEQCGTNPHEGGDQAKNDGDSDAEDGRDDREHPSSPNGP